MSESAGDKTELPTQRKLEEAIKHGQIPRSAEVQSVFVIGGAALALYMTSGDLWSRMVGVHYSILGHLHDIPISRDTMQGYAAKSALVLGACVGPVLLGAASGGLIAGLIQSRFQSASEALEWNWGRLNPIEGMKRVFSVRALVPALMGIIKLTVLMLLTYSQVKQIADDPIFRNSVDVARIAGFLAESAFNLTVRILGAMAVIGAADYGYQAWRIGRDLMMTKEEVKEEAKNSEGNPQVKARQRRRRPAKTQRQMLMDVATADVVVTNPTHLAVALKYDKKAMGAPKVVAKGARLNALRIREMAKEHGIPVIENKPLARMLFKYVRVGGEIPAQFYGAVAELLAWVYRVNRFRYYSEQSRS